MRGACHQTRQCRPSYSLPGISKGLFTEVVRDDHLDPETLTQRMRLKPETCYITDLPGKPDNFSCLLGLGCAHLCQGKLGGCCHAGLPHSHPLQELLRTPLTTLSRGECDSCPWSHLILLLDQVTAPRCLGGLTLGSQPDWPPWEVPCGSEDKLHTLKWETNPHEGSSLPLLVSIYFSACLMQFFFSLYLLHCCDLLAIIWFLYGKKKLCYRNQHTIFLNLERRYYGDWKYGQVSNINV